MQHLLVSPFFLLAFPQPHPHPGLTPPQPLPAHWLPGHPRDLFHGSLPCWCTQCLSNPSPAGLLEAKPLSLCLSTMPLVDQGGERKQSGVATIHHSPSVQTNFPPSAPTDSIALAQHSRSPHMCPPYTHSHRCRATPFTPHELFSPRSLSTIMLQNPRSLLHSHFTGSPDAFYQLTYLL